MNELSRKLFDINHPSLPLEVGRLLVAEPFLRDEYFNHSVILLVDYADGQNAMGLVLNNPTDYSFGELLSNPEIDEKRFIPVFCGGPMSRDRLFYVHTLGSIFPGSHQIKDGLYIGGDISSVLEYLEHGYPIDGCIRFFAGYSGWDAGQLEDEVANHVWAVTNPLPAKKLLTGNDGNGYWHKMVREMGEDYRGWLYHPMFPVCN